MTLQILELSERIKHFKDVYGTVYIRRAVLRAALKMKLSGSLTKCIFVTIQDGGHLENSCDLDDKTFA
ncbi:hypothetical protein HNY73_018287 [Argiope bruennichi]|uniref:Uncharacterized protein n=1 Tax=Argiope bruennichi TaxID=94029 RepID=A0A8T0EHC0_ARGBR|nr:hypothetical protein HNY73_018287 [Argiope bruennichi]